MNSLFDTELKVYYVTQMFRPAFIAQLVMSLCNVYLCNVHLCHLSLHTVHVAH